MTAYDVLVALATLTNFVRDTSDIKKMTFAGNTTMPVITSNSYSSSNQTKDPESFNDGGGDPTFQSFIKANNEFTGKLTVEVQNQNGERGIVLSAFSVFTPLAQLALAAEGATRDELLNIMGLTSEKDIAQAFGILANKLKNDEGDVGVVLNQASKIYVDKDVSLNKKFQSMSMEIFQSEIDNIDFGESQEAAKVMNHWVEYKTNKKIKDLVQSNDLKPKPTLVLINAIYFKGSWTHQFDRKQTKSGNFFMTETIKFKVPMMNLKKYLEYYESQELNAKLLKLPYGRSARTYMLIILPNEVRGLPDLQQKLKKVSSLVDSISEMSSQMIQLSFPKFKIETRTDLKQVLMNVGVKEIFRSTAKLTKMVDGADDKLFVSSAIQKAFIEVNEEGTEAAAANTVVMKLSASLVKKSIQVTVDHPFVFVIGVDEIVLFNGAVVSPKVVPTY